MGNIILGVIAIMIGIVLFILMLHLMMSLMRKRSSARYLEDEIANVVLSALFAGMFLMGGFLLLPISIDSYKETQAIEAVPTVQELCEKNHICYELVQTVAEHTKYTEEELVEFFIIVSDDIDAWTAIHLLDGSLTGEQIDALLEISAMKQAE